MHERPVPRSDRLPLAPLVPAPDPKVGQYLQTYYWFRWLILLMGVGTATLGVGLSLVKTPMYRASATMAVTQSKLDESTAIGASSAAGYLPFVRNYSGAIQVIKKHNLDRPPHNLTPTKFLEGSLTVTEIRNTNLLVASVVLSDPNLAAAVVNDVTGFASALSQQLNQDEAVRSRDLIGRYVAELRGRLKTAETSLLEFRRVNQIELLRGEVEALLGQQRQLPDLTVKLASERARLARAETELASRDRLTTVRRSIDADPTMMEAARASGKEGSTVLGLSMQSEDPNPVFESLDTDVATIRAEVSALEKHRAFLIEVNKLGGVELAKLTQLYVKESELARLQTDRDLAQQAYLDAAARYESATLTVASRSAELQVIDPGFPPDRPYSPRPIRDGLLGLLIGLSGAAVAVGLYHSVRTLQPLLPRQK